MSLGFWGAIVFLVWATGGLSIWVGFFEYNELPLGLSGIILVLFGFYLLVVKRSAILCEFRERRRFRG